MHFCFTQNAWGVQLMGRGGGMTQARNTQELVLNICLMESRGAARQWELRTTGRGHCEEGEENRLFCLLFVSVDQRSATWPKRMDWAAPASFANYRTESIESFVCSSLFRPDELRSSLQRGAECVMSFQVRGLLGSQLCSKFIMALEYIEIF